MAFSRPTSGGVQLPRGGAIWDGGKDKDAVLLIMGEGPAAATAAEEK
ncbi:hypothetical protein [Bradyrhizobium japonicum]|nr:hypothetical protein [Bradyrhizobium japonicum]MCD9104621.1 hypothetical protein [Bradyrhizobium japonicum]MCD9254899.1 hypothetical protein [Bradyrhizobium japonicum SEMIA 5079]MCD9909346.1 hypothetical protein [Bradyrhizobium japonicum]MCS3977233.1 hypothetical protein [Bradyrhizobium japonicum]WRI67576.1 hypothetical protein RZE83_23555 [Bradyrhizobium japonicum]